MHFRRCLLTMDGRSRTFAAGHGRMGEQPEEPMDIPIADTSRLHDAFNALRDDLAKEIVG